jgi:hypothetical protein
MELTPLPVDVSVAISAVMGGIKTLGKDNTNAHQRYDFVSTDKFLAAVNPLCVQAGLVILQEEESIEIKPGTDGKGGWLVARYGFTLAHKSGAAWGPLHRTVMVQANGAQAFGSAQSYALKQFMRSLFQIPTGDKDDADLQPAEELPHRNGKSNGKTESDETKQAREMYAGIVAAIKAATHPGDTALGLKVDRKDREDIAFIRKHGGNVPADALLTKAAEKIAELCKPQGKAA